MIDNHHFEVQLIGAMMHDNSVVEDVLEALSVQDFRDTDHRLVFESLASIHHSGLPVNLVNIADHLGVDGILRLQAGYVKLADLWESASRETEIRELIAMLKLSSAS